MTVESERKHGFRQPSAAEKRLLAHAAASATGIDPAWPSHVQVRSLADGGMGSLQLWLPESSEPRQSGGEAAVFEFWDADGVLVSVALILDQAGLPFELDVWKVDFSPLICVPETL